MFCALQLRLHMVVMATVAAVLGSAGLDAIGQTSPAKEPAGCWAYASVPLPPEADQGPVPKKSPACGSYRSYRGIFRSVNYAGARACAWQERRAQQAGLSQNGKEPTAWVVGGSLILADMYFNGAGVKRDVPLAMRFACESEEEMAKLAWEDIEKQGGVPGEKRPFEFCDYAATTFSMNFCGAYESDIEDDRRSRYFNSLKPSMTAEQRAAFEKLLAAEAAYVTAHAFEVDQQGSIHNIRTMGSQKILDDLFRTELIHFESKRWPPFSPSQIATAEPALRREYEKELQRLHGVTEEEKGDGAVTAEGFAQAEKAWEAYRDAWGAFARVRYPAAVETIRAEITMRRYGLLKTID